VILDIRDSQDRSHLLGDDYRYPYSLDWPAEMVERMAEYFESYRAFATLGAELVELRTDIAQGEAQDLWEQA
jgi:hypothetical protein